MTYADMALRRVRMLAMQVAGASKTPQAAAKPPMAIRAMSTQSEAGSLVRLETGSGGVAKLTLCRPKKLNSLSLPMIRELRSRYAELRQAGVRCLLLGGEGRALCAGGDVAEVREGVLEGNRTPVDFFYEEYVVDYEIATLREREGILQIALWDGIVMGGGVGLSAHSPFRIATEKTLFAMPETLIGLFPDVGMTWKLSRLGGGMPIGIFLGLTGQRLGAADCLTAGLATHFCPSERLPQVEASLRSLGPDRLGDMEAVSSAISEAAGGVLPDTAKAMLAPNAAAIERCFGAGVESAEDIMGRLEAESSDFARHTLEALRQRSPTSVKVTLEAILRHRSATLKEAFTTEYRLSQWCCRPQPLSDLCEGIRAVLVDKDNQPQWDPARLEDVTRERVEGFFAPLGPEHPRGELML
mmetsp:Transcript_76630/g.222511  ORF Transcript_76630/g.222511 Transcript_76630/m.222511 type:complete len:413 (-) Transcript_76630:216-1454(-)